MLGREPESAAKEFIEALATKYHQCLENAADSFSAADHSREAASAAHIIARIEALLLCSTAISAANRLVGFEKLLGRTAAGHILPATKLTPNCARRSRGC